MTEEHRDEDRPTRIDRPVDRGPGGRILGGVCAGLGAYTGVDPIVFRVAAVIVTVGTAGFGALVYAAGWLLTADRRSSAGWLERRLNRRFDGTSVLLLLTALSTVGLAFAIGSRTESGGALAIFVVLGVGLLVAHARGVNLLGMVRDMPDRLRHTPLATEDEPVDLAAFGSRTATGAAEPPRYGAVDLGRPRTGRQVPDAAFGTGLQDPDGPFDLASLGGGPRRDRAAPAGHVDLRTFDTPRQARRNPTFLFPATFCAAAIAGLTVSTVPTGMHGWSGLATPMRAVQYGLAAALVVIGLGVVVGTWYGRPRSLISLGVLIAIALTLVSWGRVNGMDEGRVGNVVWRPSSVAELSQPFRSRFGDSKLDLTRLHLKKAQHVTVRAQSSIGHLQITVPEAAKVHVQGHTSFGDIQIDGHTRGGRDIRVDSTLPPIEDAHRPPVIDLVLRNWFGDIEVTRGA